MPQNPNPFYSLDRFIQPFNGLNSPSISRAPEPSLNDLPGYDFYTPQYELQNRFARLLDDMPQPNNPSKWRKLGAVITGAGAGLRGENPIEASRNFAYAPYLNQMEQWKTVAPFVQQAADNERQANQIGLNANNQFRQRQIDEEKNRIAEVRANAYAFKQTHPNWESEALPGGNLVYFNPQNPTERYDTGYPSGKMPEYDRLNLLANAAMARTVQAGANAANVAGINAASRTDVANLNNATDAEIAAANNAARIEAARLHGTTGNTPAQQRIALQNRTNTLRIEHPEWVPFLEFDYNGDVIRIKEPGESGGFFGMSTVGPDEATYKRIQDYLLSDVQRPSTPAVPAQIPAPAQVPAPAQTGTQRFRVGNDEYQIPADRVSDFLRDNPTAARIQ